MSALVVGAEPTLKASVRGQRSWPAGTTGLILNRAKPLILVALVMSARSTRATTADGADPIRSNDNYGQSTRITSRP